MEAYYIPLGEIFALVIWIIEIIFWGERSLFKKKKINDIINLII